MLKKLPYLCLLLVLSWSCSPKVAVKNQSDEATRALADQLAHKYIIIDGQIGRAHV